MNQIIKPVGILLHGPSLKYFDEAIQHFRDLDVFWVSLNNFWIAGDIIKKIGKELDAVFSFTNEPGDLIQIKPKCEQFEKEGGQVIRPADFFRINIHAFDGNQGYPSFYYILFWFLWHGAKNAFVFGGNGEANSKEEFYYTQEKVMNMHNEPVLDLAADTKIFNRLVTKDTYPGMSIYNCCPESKYISFPKITCEEAITIIKRINHETNSCFN